MLQNRKFKINVNKNNGTAIIITYSLPSLSLSECAHCKSGTSVQGGELEHVRDSLREQIARALLLHHGLLVPTSILNLSNPAPHIVTWSRPPSEGITPIHEEWVVSWREEMWVMEETPCKWVFIHEFEWDDSWQVEKWLMLRESVMQMYVLIWFVLCKKIFLFSDR